MTTVTNRRCASALTVVGLVACLVVAGCGSSTRFPLDGPAISGPHEQVTLSFYFNGPPYEQASAGSVCTAPASEPMFVKGLPVTAKSAEGPETDEGNASLPAGFIAMRTVGTCDFQVNMDISLGPNRYTFQVGESGEFGVSFNQADIVRDGATANVDGIDMEIVATG